MNVHIILVVVTLILIRLQTSVLILDYNLLQSLQYLLHLVTDAHVNIIIVKLCVVKKL